MIKAGQEIRNIIERIISINEEYEANIALHCIIEQGEPKGVSQRDISHRSIRNILSRDYYYRLKKFRRDSSKLSRQLIKQTRNGA